MTNHVWVYRHAARFQNNHISQTQIVLLYCLESMEMIHQEGSKNQTKMEKMANPKPFTKLAIQIEGDQIKMLRLVQSMCQ